MNFSTFDFLRPGARTYLSFAYRIQKELQRPSAFSSTPNTLAAMFPQTGSSHVARYSKQQRWRPDWISTRFRHFLRRSTNSKADCNGGWWKTVQLQYIFHSGPKSRAAIGDDKQGLRAKNGRWPTAAWIRIHRRRSDSDWKFDTDCNRKRWRLVGTIVGNNFDCKTMAEDCGNAKYLKELRRLIYEIFLRIFWWISQRDCDAIRRLGQKFFRKCWKIGGWSNGAKPSRSSASIGFQFSGWAQ